MIIMSSTIIILNNDDFMTVMESLQKAYEDDDSCYLNGSVKCNNCGDCI